VSICPFIRELWDLEVRSLFFWQPPPILLWVYQTNQRNFQFLWLLCLIKPLWQLIKYKSERTQESTHREENHIFIYETIVTTHTIDVRKNTRENTQGREQYLYIWSHCDNSQNRCQKEHQIVHTGEKTISLYMKKLWHLTK